MIHRGEVWWADLIDPVGSEPGYRRPVLIVQAEWANAGASNTVIVAMLTSNLAATRIPGSVQINARDSGLPRPSVVNVSQVATINRRQLDVKCGLLPAQVMRMVDDGICLFLQLR